MADPRPLTRDELAQFLPTQRAIRAFEQLFRLIPTDLIEVLNQAISASVDASTALAQGNAAADALDRLADAVEQLAKYDPPAVQAMDAIEFNRGEKYDKRVGSISWSDADDTLEIRHSNDVTMQIGLEEYSRATNCGAATIQNGQVAGLYLAGPVGVTQFIADGSVSPYFIVGVATETITAGEVGRITVRGFVRDIDTTGAPYGETWAVGDILYASPTIAGGLTKVRPLPPNIEIPTAVVVSANATTGIIAVRPTILLPFRFGGFASDVDQSITAANTPQAATLNQTIVSSGISIGAPASHLVFAHSGLYFVNVAAQFVKSSAATGIAWLWLRRNGVDESLTSVKVTLSGSGAQALVSKTFALRANSGDYIQVMAAADNTATSLNADPAAGSIPAIPSVGVTIYQNSQ